jgi:hypothetical protein
VFRTLTFPSPMKISCAATPRVILAGLALSLIAPPAVRARASPAVLQASISTDKSDYAPQETVSLRGHGWTPGESITVVVRQVPEAGADRILQFAADKTGSFLNQSFCPDDRDVGKTLIATARGSISGVVAQTKLTDQNPLSGFGPPDVTPLVGPVSQDRDLRDLPDIPATPNTNPPLRRHPFSSLRGNAIEASVSSPVLSSPVAAMPTPLVSFDGVSEVESGCGCLPPDPDGDVGPNHFIQSVNTSIKIYDKTGTVLAAAKTYNSFFSALGPSTPCGNNENRGDGVVFYDHLADRWVVSDMAFPTFPGTSFYQCFGVSKGSDPVSGGWWLYALQVDPSNPANLGDYPKFGLWPDAYYMTVNLFSDLTTFNGVRVYALDRGRMINGTGAPAPSAVAFSISPATLGNAYSLLPATFRFGAPPAGAPEYLLAINSSQNGGDIENQVFAWRFHVDFATPANSTLGIGPSSAPNATITVNNFVEAIQGSGASAHTEIVPQGGATQLLDSLGDKLMNPLYYQNRGGAESLYVSHTVNNGQGGTGPTGIRWYQFNVTGGTIPAGAGQQQTFTNGGDGLFRWMPSLALDSSGDLSIGYSASSASVNPSIRYAGRLASDLPGSLAQGEALLIQGAGSQTSSSSRWGDYSATAVDVADGCTFWHTNEYYASTSVGQWSTRIGAFKFLSCGSTATGKSFYTLPACRVADTRNAVGPSGGPALLANTVRSFPVTGLCGIPNSATAVAIDIAVILPTDVGDLRAFPTGGTAPLASAINFRAGIVRANNAIVPLGLLGQLSIQCDMPPGSSGTTNFLFDVYGYFQ